MTHREASRRFRGPAKPGFLRRALRAVRAGLGILLTLALTLYGALCRFGLPPSVRERVETVAAGKGLHLRIQRIRPSWPGTWVLDRVRLSPGRSAMEARFDRVRFRLDLREAFRGRLKGAEVSMEEGELSIPLGKAAADGDPGPFLVQLPSGTLRKSGSRVELNLNARVLDGLTVRVTGAMDLSGWEPAAPRRPLEETVAGFVDLAAPVLRKVRQVSGNVVWGDRAGVALELSGGPGQPGGLCAVVRAEGRNGFAYGQRLEAWSASAEYREGRVEPLDVRISCAGDEMRLQGRVDPAGRSLDLSAEGTWNSASVLRRVRGWIPDESAIPPDPVLRGSARLEIRTGKVPWTNVTAGLRARIRIEEPAEFYGVPFSRLDLEVRRDGAWIRGNLAELDLGWIAGTSRIAGSGAYCPATGEFEGRASGTGDPASILDLLTPSEAHLLGNLRFLGEAPRLGAEFRGVFGDPSRFELTGQVEGRDFVYQGTSVDEARFDLAVRNETVQFDRLVVKRPEGELTGRVALFLRDGRVEFEAASRLTPGAVARVIGPTSHRFIQQFRFEGPVSVSGRGNLRYRGPVSGDVRLEIEAWSAGMDWMLADEIACTLTLADRRLELSGIRGRAYGGSFSGDARIDLPSDGEDPPSYSVRGAVVDAEIVRLLRDLRPSLETKPELGQVTLRADLKGRIGEGAGPSVTGTGTCEVRGSRLFSLPLLGGLSKIFSRITPGLGYLSQSEFTADCRVQDSRIHSSAVRLTGPWLSMRARGSLGFDLSLNYLVEAQPLRKGPIAGTVRVLTMPLTKLLEFELGGTVLEPRWRAKNFSPEELPAAEPEAGK